MEKRALLLGSTGLVGRHLLSLLLESGLYGKILCPVRSSLGITHPLLEEKPFFLGPCLEEKEKTGQILGKNQTELQESLKVDDIFCCLGTTIAKAKTKENFRRIDFHYPLLIASEAAKVSRPPRFFLVSSIGARSSSLIFYEKVKGELEEELQKLDLAALHIFRPSLLLGERKEKRTAEKWGGLVIPKLSFLFNGPWRKYRPIEALDVARAMLGAAQKPSTQKGCFIHEGKDFETLSLVR